MLNRFAFPTAQLGLHDASDVMGNYYSLNIEGDTVRAYESFVTKESIVTVATKLRQHLPALNKATLRGVTNDCVALECEAFYITIRKRGLRSIDDGKQGVLSVSALGAPELVRAAFAYLDGQYAKEACAKLSFWFNTKDGPHSVETLLRPFGAFNPEYYPWLEPDIFDRYFASSASVLFMMGPPGTGKTSVLRHAITSRGLRAAATYDKGVVAHDEMFLEFIESDQQLLVLEDADDLVHSRGSGGNDLIARFLSYSDGLAKFPEKKILFSTNLEGFQNVDPALTRRGRCFGALRSRPLRWVEIEAVARLAGVPLPSVPGEYTLADVLNAGDEGGIEPRKVGFAA